jgi:hypothetical protein
MTPQRALQLALNFLTPFQEAGNIYEDYIADEGITDGEYQEMLDALERLVWQSTVENHL